MAIPSINSLLTQAVNGWNSYMDENLSGHERVNDKMQINEGLIRSTVYCVFHEDERCVNFHDDPYFRPMEWGIE